MFTSVHNFYEQLVFERILILAKERDEPLTQDFAEDIACIALNRLPPRYIRHHVDLVFKIGDTERAQLHDQVIRAVDEAIEFAKRRQTSH